jgi:hypothetical protein
MYNESIQHTDRKRLAMIIDQNINHLSVGKARFCFSSRFLLDHNLLGQGLQGTWLIVATNFQCDLPQTIGKRVGEISGWW